MISQLFWILVLFSAVIGFGLASNHGSAWWAMIYSVVAVVVLQASYAVTLFVVVLTEH
jgi:hypothetical protein